MTIGLSGEASSRSSLSLSRARPRAVARSGAMTANGFSSRFFRSRKRLDRLSVAGIHHQVVAADPLDSQDCAGLEQFAGPDDRRILFAQDGIRMAPAAGAAARRPGRRSAGRESGGRRVVVFLPAVRAERKGSHGRVGPVVGDAGDDAVAGAAVGAGDEGVAEAPVCGIEQFPQAVVAEAASGATW